MLAAHLSRLSQRKPVRYAMDADQMAAVQNYINLHLRAQQLPVRHWLAQTNSVGLQDAYEKNPRLPATFSSLIESSHPADLMAYLDQMEEAGHPVPPNTGGGLANHMLYGLGDIRQRVLGGTPEDLERITRGYHPDTLGSNTLYAMLHNAMTNSPRTDQLRHPLRRLLYGLDRMQHPQYGQLAGLFDQLMHGSHPMHVSRMYDMAHQLAFPTNVEDHAMRGDASDARAASGHLLQHSIIPTLEHYGAAGRFPAVLGG